MKCLIVTGDDFGISRGINRGIVEAHLSGIVTSTSLMVDRPACEEAVALARRCPTLSLGLHLELDAVDPELVPTEIGRQHTRFVELVGSAPTHVDTHHDVHRDPRILSPLLAWGRREGVPVRGHSGVRYFSKFYGQWGGESHREQISVEVLLRLLDAEDLEGMTELNCHPGYVEPGFPSSYAAEREVELRTLCDPGLRHAILERGVRLIGFRDLPTLAAPAEAIPAPGDAA
ncbi:MAG: ChbG/HpnK family deacetylase [Deltaproteobacteria bacterium]|nr:MAG: ChbG/HpnK family deacetylase [Deltaproteobacteria bacterium]